jgi:hypothetical protein
MFHQFEFVCLKSGGTGSAGESLDSAIAATGGHSAWYFKERLRLLRCRGDNSKKDVFHVHAKYTIVTLWIWVWVARVRCDFHI